MDGGSWPTLDETPPPDIAARWVAINTHPHRERIAVENLQRQEFIVYCPSELKRVRHARRTQDALYPLFPGYVFAEVLPERTPWRRILSTYGVRSLIRFGEQPAYVDDGFIAELRAREVDGVIVRPATSYCVGQAVRLNGGPFDGLIATIIEMGVKDRLVLLTRLLSQEVRLKVAATAVRTL